MSLIKSEKTEKNVYTIEFSVEKATFDKAVNNAYRKQVGKINVPGFRKGKAPRSVIEKMYGKGFFYEVRCAFEAFATICQFSSAKTAVIKVVPTSIPK